jgi:hypothetical protein
MSLITTESLFLAIAEAHHEADEDLPDSILDDIAAGYCAACIFRAHRRTCSLCGAHTNTPEGHRLVFAGNGKFSLYI